MKCKKASRVTWDTRKVRPFHRYCSRRIRRETFCGHKSKIDHCGSDAIHPESLPDSGQWDRSVLGLRRRRFCGVHHNIGLGKMTCPEVKASGPWRDISPAFAEAWHDLTWLSEFGNVNITKLRSGSDMLQQPCARACSVPHATKFASGISI